jgi:hypothetical protein
MLLEIFSFRRLQIEPGVRKCLDMGEQSFYEWVKFILKNGGMLEIVLKFDPLFTRDNE